MSRLTRYTQKLFGNSASSNQIAEFGSLANGSPSRYSGTTITPSIIQALSTYSQGWFSAVLGQSSPAIEDMNALCYLFAYQLSYLMQAGVAEWDSGTTYFTNDMVNYLGTIYVSKIDSNLNIAPSSNATDWHVIASDTGPVVAAYLASVEFTDIAGASINFDSKIYDTNNIVTAPSPGAGSWFFTAPVTGYYRISGNLNTGGAGDILRLYVNGSVKIGLLGVTQDTSFAITYLSTVQLTAGDTAFVSFQSNVEIMGTPLLSNAACTIFIELMR